jgi:hypothetical protein
MGVKKINSETKSKSNGFKITIGTTDKKNPNSVYIGFGGYITPITEEKAYADKIRLFEIKMKRNAETIISDGKLSDRNIIFVSEIAHDRMKLGKKTYFDLQIYTPLSKNILDITKRNFGELSDIINKEYVPKLSEKIMSLMTETGFSCLEK